MTSPLTGQLPLPPGMGSEGRGVGAGMSRPTARVTALGGAGRSIVRLALELASSRIDDWSRMRILLVGTGQYAATTVATSS